MGLQSWGFPARHGGQPVLIQQIGMFPYKAMMETTELSIETLLGGELPTDRKWDPQPW